MTLAPLAFDFALMSPLSKRPPHAIPRAEMLAEAEQELADRRALYGRLVDKGKMAPADAERHIATLAEIRDDLADAGRPVYAQAYGWDAKVRELRRELAMRRNSWPKRLAKPGDPLDPAAAARRMERLDAVHFLYWIELFQCDFGQHGVAMLHSLAEILDAARAYAWRVAAWERAAAASGEAAHLVRPAQLSWYADLDRGAPDAVRIWQSLETAAAKHGFVTIDQAA